MLTIIIIGSLVCNNCDTISGSTMAKKIGGELNIAAIFMSCKIYIILYFAIEGNKFVIH